MLSEMSHDASDPANPGDWSGRGWNVKKKFQKYSVLERIEHRYGSRQTNALTTRPKSGDVTLSDFHDFIELQND